MNINLAAIGKFKKTEALQALTIEYLERAQVTGRNFGFGNVKLIEFDIKNSAPNPEKEAEVFLNNIPQNAFLIILDERGQNISSIELAKKIEHNRDNGIKDITFAIGGADGHGQAIKNRANLLLSFGKLTWPHKLCRAMAAEQIYRAISIIAGTPYHRE